MKRSNVGITLALVGGGVVLALCAVVLLLQWPDAERDAPAPRPLEPTPPRAARQDAGVEPLPAPEPGDAAASGPSRLSAERPRVGPEALVGRVVDGATDEPVADFQVHVLPAAPEDPLARLDQAQPEPFHHRLGVFRLPRDPGRYDVVVLAPGYEPSVIREWIVPAQDLRAVRVPLDRGPGITGTVYGMHSGLPLPGVEVFLHVLDLDDPDARVPQRRRAVTQHDGRYSFSPLPPGSYGLSLLEPGNRTDYLSPVRVGRGTTLQDLWLLPRHDVVVRVQELDGRPSVGARVTLQGSGLARSGSTNEHGQVFLEHVPDGSYALEARQEGFETIEQELHLEGGLGQHVTWLRFTALAD